MKVFLYLAQSYQLLTGNGLTDKRGKPVDVRFPVVDQAVSQAIFNMVEGGEGQIAVNGVVIQNGLTTNQVSYLS